LLLVPAVTLAQTVPDTKAGDAMIEKYLAAETDRLQAKFLDGAKTRAEWEAKRPRLRREYLDMLGLWPLPERTPLHATVTGTREHAGVVIERLHYQSKPGLYVTANLYRPKEPTGRLPAILYVCGHSGRGRDGNKTAFQDHGLGFARNGYVCLIVDTLQLGEVPGTHHGTYREGRWWWQALGYTPAGVECWNGIRGIDYLVSRPDVDPERLGVTGISGGGAATIWIAAADERVKVAVPVSGMSDLESYVKNKVINGHCDCMFLVNTYQWEWTTIAALIAPRPMLFANSDNDPIFPMDGNRRIIARLRELYRMYDKPGLVDDYVSKGGHDYRPDLRIAVFRWINRHLKGDTGDVKDADFKPLPGKELRVFPEDRDLPKDALNGRIDETFVKRAEVELPEAGKFAEWKRRMMVALREKSFRGLSDRPGPAKVQGLSWWDDGPSAGPSPTRMSFAYFGGRGIGGAIVLRDAAARTEELPSWAGPFVSLNKTEDVCLLPLRGQSDAIWARKNPPNYVERSFALLGGTADERRVRDVAGAARAFQERQHGNHPWRIVARGPAGILAAYAALFEPSIKEVVIVDPPTSHRDGPIFLNVLRVLDIPEALGLLAPDVKLTLVNAKGPAFERTAQLYKLAGAEKNFQRK
jgi:dienelactone hydrolase